MDRELHDIPFPLSLDRITIPFDSGVGDPDYIVGGIEWLSYASEQYPYQRGLVKVLKEQLDTSQQPGDASLEGWWTRSQTDWSGGAGQEWMEPASDEMVLRMYADSSNVDVFTKPGDVTLLPRDVEAWDGTSNVPPNLLRLNNSNFLASHDDKVYASSSMTDYTAAGNVRSMILAGGKALLALDNNTIEVVDVATMGLVATIDHTAIPGEPMMRWVKGRVIMGVQDKLWELVDLTADITLVDAITGTRDQTMPIVSMNDSGWQFSGACSTPTSILVSGYGQSNSSILALTVDDKGTLPDISAPVEVAQFPVSEHVTDIASYLGSYVAIATDAGLRVGTTEQGGGIVYGPLIGSPVPAQRVGTFSMYDRFVHYVDADGNMIKVDLSSTDDAGRYAWSKWTHLDDAVTGVAYGARSSMMVHWEGATGHVSVHQFDDANGLVQDGWIKISKIRLGTLERKYWDQVTVQKSGGGYIGVTANGTLLGLASTDTTVLKFGAVGAAVSQELQFDLKGDSVLQAWSLRAMPAIENRGQTVLLPCLNFDFETDSRGVKAGWEGRAWERWEAATRLYTRGTSLTITETKTTCTYQAVVEDMSFTQIAPPTNASGFGGVVQLVLKTV